MPSIIFKEELPMSNQYFPITTAQYSRGHLTSEGAENIALLQDLSRTVKPKTMHASLNHNDGDPLGLCGILASALADDDAFAQLYPDQLLLSPDATIAGNGLPGLRQDEAGQWDHVDPRDATVQERRDYVRRHLIVNAAKKILAVMDRPATDRIAVTQPHRLHTTACLVNVATDVCKKFEPDFLSSLNSLPLTLDTSASMGFAGA